MVKMIKPDHDDQYSSNCITLFCAGSINAGSSFPWADDLKNYFENKIHNKHISLCLFNPRRDTWNPTLEQKQSNEEFNHQVNWELNNLEKSDIIFMNILSNSISPISLLELGMFARYNIIVCCPKAFWCSGNVEIVCCRFNIPLFTDYE